jgi:hypothetical protein
MPARLTALANAIILAMARIREATLAAGATAAPDKFASRHILPLHRDGLGIRACREAAGEGLADTRVVGAIGPSTSREAAASSASQQSASLPTLPVATRRPTTTQNAGIRDLLRRPARRLEFDGAIQ